MAGIFKQIDDYIVYFNTDSPSNATSDVFILVYICVGQNNTSFHFYQLIVLFYL